MLSAEIFSSPLSNSMPHGSADYRAKTARPIMMTGKDQGRKRESSPQHVQNGNGLSAAVRSKEKGRSFRSDPHFLRSLDRLDRRHLGHIDLQPRPHGRAQRDLLDVLALGAGRLGTDDGVDEGFEV